MKKCKISKAALELACCEGLQTAGLGAAGAVDVVGFGAFDIVLVSDTSELLLSLCKLNSSSLETLTSRVVV